MEIEGNYTDDGYAAIGCPVCGVTQGEDFRFPSREGAGRAFSLKKPTFHACRRSSPSMPVEKRRQFKKCGRCRHVKYCSSACQTKDWPKHEASCKEMSNILNGFQEAGLGSTTRGLAHLQDRVSALIDGPLRGKFLPPAIAQAFSLRPHDLMKWTPPPGGPLPSTHTIWLHFTYDSNEDADLLRAFTLTQGRILPHAEILAIINERHPLSIPDARRTPFPPNTFSQSWLNHDMGMAAAPSYLFKFPFVISATPINNVDAVSGKLRLSTVLSGTALCAPPLREVIDFGIPAPDRWLKDLKGRMKAARTPLSAEKLAAKKQQAAEALAEFLWYGEGDAETLKNLWWSRERWNQHYGIVSLPRYRLSMSPEAELHLSFRFPPPPSPFPSSPLSFVLFPPHLTSHLLSALTLQEESGRVGLRL